MKKICLILAIALIAYGSAVAQAADTSILNGQGSAPPVVVNGSLSLVNGKIAIRSNDKTYYLEGIQHLTGFVDGLKEGAVVQVEGCANAMSNAPEYIFLHLTKLTFNGKEYAISRPVHHSRKESKG